MQDPKVTSITLPMGSVQEAVQYWLSNVVFRESIDVKCVSFAKHSETFNVSFVPVARKDD